MLPMHQSHEARLVTLNGRLKVAVVEVDPAALPGDAGLIGGCGERLPRQGDRLGRHPRLGTVRGSMRELPAGHDPRFVGLGGLEPPASSLSGIEGSALCGAAFSRSLATVRGEGMRSNRTPGSAHTRYVVAAGKVCHQPVANKAIGLPVGAAARSVRRAPGSGQLRRWTGRSAAIPRRLAGCHQLRTVHRRRRGGRAPRTSRAWWACAWRWVMRCSASAWLSPACWLCMSYLRTAQLLVPSEHRLLRAGSGWSWDVPAESGRCHMPALACSLFFGR